MPWQIGDLTLSGRQLFTLVFYYLALGAVLVLVAWGCLHYFLGVPAPSALPFPEPKPISSMSEIKSGVKSLNESLNEPEIKSGGPFDYGEFTVLEWSLKRETHKYQGEKWESAVIEGLILNNFAGNNIIVQVNFRIYDKAGNFLEETFAATKPLYYGDTWSFQTNEIFKGSDIGSVEFKNITFDYLQ